GLLRARMETFTGAVSADRRKMAETVRLLLDEGPFLSSDAVANGLVDAAEFPDQVEEALARRLGQKELTKVQASDYQRVPAAKLGLEDGPTIAVLAAEGDILRHPIPYFAEETLEPDAMRRHIRALRDDEKIRAVVLRVDSPGGDAIAAEEILRELKLLAAKKPLIVSMADVAASGGYAIAMAGKRVLANAETVTGSIGVFYGKVSMEGLLEKLGLKMESLQTGKHAGIDSEFERLNPEARAKLRSLVERTYRDFVGQVAAARGRKVEEIDRVAQGRVWLGSEAARNGLIDEIGGLGRAVEAAAKEAGLAPGAKPRLVLYPPRPGLRESWERKLRVYSSYRPPAAVWKRMSVVE
ncbi:MAG: signal peptide peptidase SppA, partial [Bryobacterales bacterium]|nr:signal peptide peptidase SppA [Bryobacterales bacterium]